MLINPGAIGQALIGDLGVAEYQLVIDRAEPSDPLSMDTLLVRVAHERANEALRDRVAETVKRVAGVRANVEIVAMSSIYDPERSLKSKRLIDRRKGT